MKHKYLLIILLMPLLAVACGAPAKEIVDHPSIATTPLSINPVESPIVAPTEVQAEPVLSVPGVATMKLLSDIEGGGRKPLFTWEAIPSADRYQLIVFDQTGDPYWAWEGINTEIYMGGTDTQAPAGSSGPSIGSGYTWVVVAYDSDGKILAASEVRSISP